ncbi:hypothetical protein ACG7TL_008540 [Trametes sanguinea]
MMTMLQLLTERFLHSLREYARTQHKDFHFCRLAPGDDLAIALMRHEHYLCSILDVKLGATILNVGSGTGDIAIELARYVEAHVVGVDQSPARVEYALARVREASLSQMITFKCGSIYEMSRSSFEQEFDVIYAIESLKQGAPSFDDAYRHLAGLLKHGGKVGIIEWCWTALFDASNAEHCRLAHIIETSANLPRRPPGSRTIEAACSALERAGLRLKHHEDLASRADKIPWYAPLERAIADTGVAWTDTTEDLYPMFGGLSRETAVILVQAAKWRLFTPLALFVAEKA